jgi:hypothetical protein
MQSTCLVKVRARKIQHKEASTRNPLYCCCNCSKLKHQRNIFYVVGIIVDIYMLLRLKNREIGAAFEKKI